MRKKNLFCAMYICLSILVLSSCQKPQESTPPETTPPLVAKETPTPSALINGDSNKDLNQNLNDNSVEWVNAVENIDVSDMNIYWQSELDIVAYHFPSDKDAKLSLYVAADKSDDGEFLFDDGQDWQLLLETSGGIYPLFPRQYVQLGDVTCSVFIDNTGGEDIWHVVVEVTGTASYEIYDCVYDSAKKAFRVEHIYNMSNINYIGGSN